MSPEIEHLQHTIAQGIVDALPDDGWSQARYAYLAITQFMEERGSYRRDDGSTGSFVVEDEISDALRALRGHMAQLHANGHAWYTATVTLSAQGDFAFVFEYDSLPAFDIIPSPAKWADEFRTYPRPELEAHVPRIPE